MSKRKHRDARGDASRSSKKVKVSHEESLSASDGALVQQEGEPNVVVPEQKSLSAETTNGLTQTAPVAVEARRLAKQERRKARAETLNKIAVVPSEEVAGGEEGALVLKNKKLRRAKSDKKRGTNKSPWQVSEAIGGCLVDVDPIFSSDEKYLILAYESHVAVYDTSNSLQIRTLSTSSKHGPISAAALSKINPSQIYISFSQGLIEKWDWTEGHRVGKWALNSKIFDVAVTKENVTDKLEDLIFTIDSAKGSWFITAHRLRSGKDSQETEAHTLLKSSEPIMSLNVQEEADVLAVSAGRRLMIGALAANSNKLLKNMLYTWREFECSEWLTSLNARFSGQPGGQAILKGDMKSLSGVGSVDIAAGGNHGSIFVFRDILRHLLRKEKKTQVAPTVAERLHWHRNGVGAVKWSADGNYIISGGIETVMVLWQLDTGQKQFLPHLSAPIESLVVSPTGSSYAVRLADNSTMVLSTAELQPTVSVSGIQLGSSTLPKVRIPDVSRIAESSRMGSIFRRPAIATSTVTPGSVLLAVAGASSSRIGVASNVNAAYLQSVDIRSGSQLSRQALARTKVTDRIIGPELNILEEPDIVLLQVSHNGEWLATVEEWTPPKKDVEVSAVDQESIPEEQIARMEIYLKFWHWDTESKNWELVSRIEGPHNTNDSDRVSIGRVLDLVADPVSSGFGTIGDERQVKLWKPKARLRDGVKVKGSDGQTFVNWSCYQNILLPSSPSLINNQSMARLALSEDGSLLVVGYQSQSKSLIYMIDPVEAKVRHVHPHIFTGSLIGLGILDKYLIVLANELIVWDIVDDRFEHVISLASYGLAERNRIPATHLAVDKESKTFAVALPEISNAGGITTLQAQLAIFDPKRPLPLYHTDLPHTLKGLLPSVQRKGYIIIDTTARVRTISRAAGLPTVEHGQKPEIKITRSLENIYGDSFGNFSKNTAQAVNRQLLLENGSRKPKPATLEESEKAVVRKEELTQIFDCGHPFALPPVTKIFEQVARLFIGKVAR